MLDRARILELIPHAGASCLLDRVLSWSDAMIVCETATHLDPANPLRHAGRLHPSCGPEYGLQAAALHGALRTGTRPRGGWIAAIRDVRFHAARLDDATHGVLRVQATLIGDLPSGLSYEYALHAADGGLLVSGRGTVARRA